MIHEQEKLELLTQQVEIANNILENKIMSRQWVWDNIFEFNEHDKSKIFNDMVEDQKQKFRFEQIETEGNDPAESGASADDVEEQSGDWGGDRRSGTGKKEFGNEYDSSDLRDATKFEKERYGKREFKGKSPLATSKGSTLVAREGLMKSLKDKFGSNDSKTILSEKILINEE